jgi:hypothetical protein
MADVDLNSDRNWMSRRPARPYYDVDAEKKLHGRQARLKC